MKFTLITLSAFVALSLSVRAESTVTLKDIHNCCGSCEKGITKAVTSVDGATVTTTKTSATITAKDKATADKAVNALVAAGFYGEGAPAQSAPDKKVKSATVSGTHLCCAKCVTVVNEALNKVPGVKTNTAKKNAATFDVTGDFKPTDVFAALHQAGLTGKEMKAE